MITFGRPLSLLGRPLLTSVGVESTTLHLVAECFDLGIGLIIEGSWWIQQKNIVMEDRKRNYIVVEEDDRLSAASVDFE